MLTKKERTLLRQASDLIAKQLTDQGEVSITGFGKFYVSKVEVARGVHDPGLPAEATGVKVRNVVRFRPWEGLKKQVNNGVTITTPDGLLGVQTEIEKGPQSMPEPTAQVFMKDYKACIYCEASIPAGSVDCPECGLPQEG
jgi:nucleoid DNA-binding protein